MPIWVQLDAPYGVAKDPRSSIFEACQDPGARGLELSFPLSGEVEVTTLSLTKRNGINN